MVVCDDDVVVRVELDNDDSNASARCRVDGGFDFWYVDCDGD